MYVCECDNETYNTTSCMCECGYNNNNTAMCMSLRDLYTNSTMTCVCEYSNLTYQIILLVVIWSI